MVDLYNDYCHHISTQKASQLGYTEFLTVNLMWAAMIGRPVMHVLPDNKIRNRVVENRIDKSIQHTKLYKLGCNLAEKDVHHKGMKTLFGTGCVFTGSERVENFYEFPARLLQIDEFDKCNQKNIRYAYDRTLAVADPWIQEGGNPTLSGTGIAKLYSRSDRRLWFHKCPHCNHWQPLDFIENVLNLSPEAITDNVRCVECWGLLERLGDGEWVAATKNDDHHGYILDPVFADPKANAISSRLILYHQSKYNHGALQHWYNNIIGKVFVPTGGRITRDLMNACIESGYTMPNTAQGTVAGVDVGSVLHVNISKIEGLRRRKVFVGTVSDWDKLHTLFVGYDVTTSVIDAHPEKHKAREFAFAHSNCFICFYHDTAMGQKGAPVPDYNEHKITIDRTESLDASHEAYLRQLVILPENYESLDNGDFLEQMEASVRVEEEDSKGRPVFAWREGSQADHHRHADNYEMIAASMHTEMKVLFI